MKADIGYLGKNMQKLDMNYVAEHHGRKSESQMEVKGVLRDQASKLFRAPLISTGAAPARKARKKRKCCFWETMW